MSRRTDRTTLQGCSGWTAARQTTAQSAVERLKVGPELKRGVRRIAE
jgi:hypothetical protein